MQNDPLRFQVVRGNNVSTIIFRLKGPLVLQNIFELQEELARECPPRAIFDLAEVPYMDSAGMGLITNYYVSAARRGQTVVIAAASPRVLELFKLTRVDGVIPLAASVEDAEAAG